MAKNTTWIKGRPSPYQLREITHFPDWRNLIVWDAFFNNLSAGTMIIAALAWAAGPPVFAGILPFGLTAAFILVGIDLIVLICDLGDPLRFAHSLRVMRFTSPLSVGVWGLVSFSIFAFLGLILAWISIACNATSVCAYVLATLTRLFVVMGAIGAAVVICYKGVVFSCSSQPGVKNARWLTPFMVSDSLLMGLSVYILITLCVGGIAAIFLILPYIFLVCARCLTFALLWVDVKPRARLVYTAENKGVGWILYIVGGAAAIVLACCGVIGLALAAFVALGCGVMERYWIIGLTRPVPLRPDSGEN